MSRKPRVDFTREESPRKGLGVGWTWSKETICEFNLEEEEGSGGE